MARVQACLELANAGGIDPGDQAAIIGYNRDDCASTRALRDWLEGLRAGLIAQGKTIDRPQSKAAEIGEDLSTWKRRVAGLVARLTSDVPDDVAERSAEQQARWLLAHLIDFFRRENKAVWWEYFRLNDLSTEDLLHERAGLGGLTFLGSFGGTVKAPIHRYKFTVQETDVRADDDLKSVGGDKLGSVVAISNDDRTIDIKKRQDTAGFHPEAVFAHKFVDNQVLAESVFRIGEYVADHGIIGPGAYRAARDLLLKITPRLRGQPLEQAGEPLLAAAMRAALSLDQSVFSVQGPPGAGKTHAGARMICALVRDKRTVGVTANSHIRRDRYSHCKCSQQGGRALPKLALLGAYGSLAGRAIFPSLRKPRFEGITFHADIILSRVTLGPASSLQIIFRPEPSSDLLDHFATFCIVY